jgi:hypothetical protein
VKRLAANCSREYGVRSFGKFAATGAYPRRVGWLPSRGIIDPKRQFRVEWDLRQLIWIPDAISRAFSSGRSLVALIAGLESAVL